MNAAESARFLSADNGILGACTLNSRFIVLTKRLRRFLPALARLNDVAFIASRRLFFFCLNFVAYCWIIRPSQLFHYSK
jgi:hypothetical protein